MLVLFMCLCASVPLSLAATMLGFLFSKVDMGCLSACRAHRGQAGASRSAWVLSPKSCKRPLPCCLLVSLCFNAADCECYSVRPSLVKSGHVIFSVHFRLSACWAHKGQAGANRSSWVFTQKKNEDIPYPAVSSSNSSAQTTGFAFRLSNLGVG